MTSTTSSLKTSLGLRYEPSVFSSERNALSAAAQMVKPGVVVLGDNLQYWVVCFADAAKLEKQGYAILSNI